ILRAYQSPCSGTHCAVQWAHMPNLASRNQSGVLYLATSDSHVALNGPGATTCAGWVALCPYARGKRETAAAAAVICVKSLRVTIRLIVLTWLRSSLPHHAN